MQIFNCEQGTQEWLVARSGVITASEFKSVLAKGEGKTRAKYMRSLCAERISGNPAEMWGGNFHTMRGNDVEKEALEYYQLETGNTVQHVGFIRNDNVGYSPDGLVGDKGLVEIKTRLGDLQVELLLKNEVPKIHIPQIQAGLWVSQREWCDFISFYPGLPLFVKRIYRDERYIADLIREVGQFENELQDMIQQVKAIK